MPHRRVRWCRYCGSFDAGMPGFFCAAGQGGYGIQSSAAAGEMYSALQRGVAVPAYILEFGADERHLSSARIR
jgi:D-arginine dehydrogenase